MTSNFESTSYFSKKVKYENMADLPDRRDFIDPAMSEKIEDDIDKRRDIYFMPNDVYETTKRHMDINKYVVYVFGVLPDGSRAMVILDNIPVFFDIRVEECENAEVLENAFKSKFQQKGLSFTRSEIVKGFRREEFREQPDNWIRFYFNNLKDRHSALLYVRKLDRPGYIGVCDGFAEKRITASDDDGGWIHNFYYPKTAREYGFNTCFWNKLPAGKYGCEKKGTSRHITTNCDYDFTINVGDYKPADDEVRGKSWANRDPTMLMAWDIETYTKYNQTGDPPTESETNWDIFMICATFHWYHSNDALLKVCIVDKITDANDSVFYDEEDVTKAAKKLLKASKEKGINYASEEDEAAALDEFKKKVMMKESKYNYIIECGDEKNLLYAFMRVIKRMAPEIITAFNGGSFDWPMVREKLRRAKLLTEFKRSVSALTLNTWSRDGKNFGDTEENIHKYSWSNERVKVSAEEMANMMRLNIPGVIDTDCMIIFKQMYPRMEVRKSFSLNFFLKKNGLQGKEDLPYKVMFKYYKDALDLDDRRQEIEEEVESKIICKMIELGKSSEEIKTIVDQKKDEIVSKKMQPIVDAVAKNMAKSAKYCVVDAFRCQQLFNVRTIVGDRREIANGAYVPLFAGFYRAGGMKVRHLVGAECYHTETLPHPVMFSNARPSNKKIKYPGAWVFPPKQGLNTRRPVVGLDFASLYPSLMMCYNLSPEKSIEDGPGAREYIDKLKAKGYYVHRIDFTAEVTDENAPDIGSHFPVGGWTIRHSNVLKPGDKVDYVIKTRVNGAEQIIPSPRQGQDPLPGEVMGIFPTILMRLFEDRRVFKKQFVALDKLLEKMENVRIEAEKLGVRPDWSDLDDSDFAKTGFTRLQLIEAAAKDADDEVAADIAFERNKVDSKQKAKKVFMNTFYGEQGNTLSAIYKLLVAGGITSGGQYNIKLVADLCTALKYFVWYGDTDSCYISSPDKLFENVDNIYEKAKSIVDDRVMQLSADNIKQEDIPEDDVEFIAREFLQDHTEYRDKYKRLEVRYKKTNEISLEEFNNINEDNFQKYLDRIIEIARSVDSKLSESEEDTRRRKHLWRLTFWRIKEEYWTMMVQITRRDLTRLAEYVNEYLSLENGTKYLRMDYEEVLFPVFFTGKKKYFGFQHLEEENFHPAQKDIFIRGIDIIKQGQSDLAREIGYEIIENVCSLFNEEDMIDLVHDKIKYIYKTKWDLRHFILNGKYKPNKRNVPILEFVDRMKNEYLKYKDDKTPLFDPQRAALYTPPEPGDPFQYVVVKKYQTFDIRGRKINLKKGDKMEYVRVYTASQDTNDPLEIDLNYYMEGAIQGLLARFIAYRDEFQPNEPTLDDDAYSVKLAKKYIQDYSEKIAGIDRVEINQQGRDYRKITSRVEKSVREQMQNNHGLELDIVFNEFDLPVVEYGSGDNNWIKEKTFRSSVEKILQIAHEYAKYVASTDIECYNNDTGSYIKSNYNEGKEFIKLAEHRWKVTEVTPEGKKKTKINYGELKDMIHRYKYIDGGRFTKTSQIEKIRSMESKIKKRIIDMSADVLKIVQIHRYMISDLIMEARKTDDDIDESRIQHISNTIDEEAAGVIKEFYDAVMELAGVYSYEKTLRSIYIELSALRSKLSGSISKPEQLPNIGERTVNKENIAFDIIDDTPFN